MSVAGARSASRIEAATRNQEAINADIVRQVVRAPEDLRQIFFTEGYDGVTRWSARWQDLCDTVLRVHWLGLLFEETRQQAVLCCDRCLDMRISVDVVTSEALRVKHALE
ncbi:hypothetical protein DL93DRAFT_659083 [Clavulina sp. PMI_390]|nr:hypothetical protein DL93DRAFT_659083 [Clavulina sp. PMI_390]